MERLTDDMLTLAKAERGGLVQEGGCPSTTSSRTCAATCRCSVRGTTTSGRPSQGSSVADPDRLAQVLRNLVTNAVRHTGPDGHIDVSIGSENGAAVFAVADDGTGIEPDSSGRIFDRFHRTDEGRGRARAAAGWALRSRGRSSRRTAARSAPAQRPERARRSASGFPATRRTRGRSVHLFGVDQGDRLRGAGACRVDHLPQRRAADQVGGVASPTSKLPSRGKLGAIAVCQAGISVYVDFELHAAGRVGGGGEPTRVSGG